MRKSTGGSNQESSSSRMDTAIPPSSTNRPKYEKCTIKSSLYKIRMANSKQLKRKSKKRPESIIAHYIQKKEKKINKPSMTFSLEFPLTVAKLRT